MASQLAGEIISVENNFNLSDYWQGESFWAKEELPKIFQDICRSPLAKRFIITGPIGVGKSRLARIIAAYIRYFRSDDRKRRIMLQQYKEGSATNPHSGIPEGAIEQFTSINVATLPEEAGLAELFGIAPYYYSEVEGRAGIFENVMYIDSNHSA